MNQSKPRIGFAGMTHLGINTAIATADRGFPCICVDKDAKLVSSLNNHIFPVSEPDLQELAKSNKSSLSFSNNFSSLNQCDVVYISPDVPTNDHGQSDLTPIEAIAKEVIPHLHSSAALVILCQVPPGFTRSINYSTSRLFYQVETLVFGQAIARALYPERFIIGCADPQQSLPLAYQTLLESFECPLLPMSYESAELAKIAINCCLVSSVSVANTLAEICENIGADWSSIVPALKLDKRIGQHAYLSPGLGLSGGNLERDLETIINLGNKYSTDITTVSAWVSNSKYRKNWPLTTLNKYLLIDSPDAHVCILGLTYKPDTHSVKNSPGVQLLNNLHTFNVKAYDPLVKTEFSYSEAIKNADAIVIMTPWEEFKSLDINYLKNAMNGNIIIDPYKSLDERSCLKAGFQYFTLGKKYLTTRVS